MKRAQRVQTHQAHAPGACGLAVSPDGRYALTSGPDCAVRAHDVRSSDKDAWWRKSSADEPDLPDVPASDIHDDGISGVAISHDNTTFATACEDGRVRIFSARVSDGDGQSKLDVGSELIQACASFGGPVRALDFSPTGAFLAAAGDEPGMVKAFMTANPSSVTVYTMPSGQVAEPITHLAYDPKSEWIATVSETGRAAVWSTSTAAWTATLSLNDRRAKCVTWAPDGSRLLVGTDQGAVFVGRDGWTYERLLRDESGEADDDEESDSKAALGEDKDRNAVCAVAWSANAKYVLTARGGCTVRVWDVEQMRLISTVPLESPATSVRWHPSANAFLIIDTLGRWGVQDDVIPDHMVGPHEASEKIKLPTIPSAARDTKSAARRSHAGDSDASAQSSGSDTSREDADATRRGKLRKKKDAKKSRHTSERDEDTNDDLNDPVLSDSYGSDGRPAAPIDFNPDELSADEEEDVVAARHAKEMLQAPDDEDAYSDRSEYSRRQVERARRRRRERRRAQRTKATGAVTATVAQASFMPSSTPGDKTSTSSKRLLCWVPMAAVVSYTEDGHNTVEIEFADTNRRTIGIKDHFGFSLACVSTSGVLLASTKNEDAPGCISFRPYNSWSSKSDWTLFLSDDETPLAVALGAKFAAVAVGHAQNLVRITSLSGIETDVIGVAGRVVTMAASREQLAVVYAACERSTQLTLQIYHISGSGEVVRTATPLGVVVASGATLSWLGFTSDTCDVVAYDSAGCLWMLTSGSGRHWMPMLRNAAEGADCNWLWLAGVTSEAAIGAPCLSNERYPQAKPRPALRSVPLVAPVTSRASALGASALSERLFRTRLALGRAVRARAAAEELYDTDDDERMDADESVDRLQLEADKCVLAAMEAECRHEHNLRAFDYATRLQCTASLKYAVQLANHYKRSALAGRVEELARRRFAAAAEDGAVARRARVTSPVTPAAHADDGGGPAPDGERDEFGPSDDAGTCSGVELSDREGERGEMFDSTARTQVPREPVDEAARKRKIAAITSQFQKRRRL